MFFENKELTEQKFFKSQNLFKNHVRLGAASAIKAKWHFKKKNCAGKIQGKLKLKNGLSRARPTIAPLEE